ncbi:MAG: hypothetical protein GTN81_15580 [Proteobacteria bacterium]|nr:hypothetical protein [Pseudomonadota bacterium]
MAEPHSLAHQEVSEIVRKGCLLHERTQNMGKDTFVGIGGLPRGFVLLVGPHYFS